MAHRTDKHALSWHQLTVNNLVQTVCDISCGAETHRNLWGQRKHPTTSVPAAHYPGTDGIAGSVTFSLCNTQNMCAKKAKQCRHLLGKLKSFDVIKGYKCIYPLSINTYPGLQGGWSLSRLSQVKGWVHPGQVYLRLTHQIYPRRTPLTLQYRWTAEILSLKSCSSILPISNLNHF